jgi:hypothetical protein
MTRKAGGFGRPPFLRPDSQGGEFSGKNEARREPGPGFDYGAGHEGRTRDIYLGKVALYH